ncbi:MAG: HEAT repeat domain-containing protein, partial [Candidatus Aminicenantes bacterium]|nr:HEAT repeat domain-containing protein [Candidatus Aminicenantes bacterium]
MKKFHTLKFLNLVFMFLLCSQVYSVSPESTEFKGSKKVIKVIFDLSPGEVRYEYKNNKRIEKPVFEYNPRADIIKSLKGAGFRLTRESNQKYDLALVIVYDEKQVLSSSGIPISSTASFDFALQDEDGKIVLKESLEQRIAPSQVKNFIIKELSEMIRGRLQATDEVSFLISQLKQGRSLGRPIKRNLVKSNIPHLKRLRELNDARTIEVFVSFLRSYNPNQRLIARSALLDLDYTPPKGTKDEVAFEMVSVINGRRKLHNIIMTYGSPAIEMIIEDVKCQYTRCGGRWYGGGQITEVNPDLVLKSLTEEKMSPFLQRTIRNKQGRFVKEKRKWKQEWNDTAVTKLIEVISTEHEELYGDEQNSFCDFAIDVLGEIADKRAIEPLKRYLAAHPESTTAKEAIEKIGDPQAVEQLITALNDKEKDAREKAALVLGKIGDPRAVEPLI